MATQITTVAGFTTGDDTISSDLLKDFLIDGLAGDDNITLEEAASNFTLKSAGGDDLITVDSDVSGSSLLKGGASDDTFQFAGAVSSSSVYGGKGADSLYFARTLSGGVVTGDTGADRFTFVGKISGGALISGGDGDDSFVLNERITDSTILGGESRDSVDINENSSGSTIKTGTDNDIVRVTGKHSDLKIKGGSGDDSFDIEASFTGSGNKFYAGKGEDSIELNTTASVAVYGDNDDDAILFQAVAAVGVSAYGGEGADTIDLRLLPADSSAVVKGNTGNDSILASDVTNSDTIATTIFGGQGNDTIVQDQSGTQNLYLYGDKGDDVIDHDSNEQSLLSGGIGADSIVLDTVSTDTDKPHTVIGGAGVDTLDVAGVQTGDHNTTDKYAPTDETTVLTFSSFAELFTAGDFVDDINIESNNTAVVAEVSGALTFTDSDEFDRATVAGVARDATREGLVIRTSSTVTDGSSVVLSATAADNLFGIDVSAGTTGNTTIDASAETSATLGMLLKGGSGRNTIKGTGGLDVIVGGKNDVLLGNGSADIIYAEDGKDSIEGGAGADSIMLSTNLTFQDTIKGGDDTDTLSYKASSATVTTDLDNVTEIEVITLGDAKTKVITKDTLVAASGTISVSAAALTSTNTLEFSGAAEADGSFVFTGSINNDTITGGAIADTFTGGTGTDSLKGGTGNDVFRYTAAAEGADIIVDFETGTNIIRFVVDDISGNSASDVFDTGDAVGVTLANTDPTDTAGTLVALAAGDYAEGASADNFYADNKVNVWTHAAGAANLAAALQAIHAGGSTVGNNQSVFLVWYDSTATVTTLSHVTDSGTAGANAVGTTIATFEDVAAADIAASFAVGNFGVESLG